MGIKSKMYLEHLPGFKAWIQNQPSYQVSGGKCPGELFRVKLAHNDTPKIFYQDRGNIIGYGTMVKRLMERYLKDCGQPGKDARMAI